MNVVLADSLGLEVDGYSGLTSKIVDALAIATNGYHSFTKIDEIPLVWHTKVMIALDQSFTNIVFYKVVNPFTDTAIFKDLNYNTVYYWKVKFVNAYDGSESAWSNTCSFKIKGHDISIQHECDFFLFQSFKNRDLLNTGSCQFTGKTLCEYKKRRFGNVESNSSSTTNNTNINISNLDHRLLKNIGKYSHNSVDVHIDNSSLHIPIGGTAGQTLVKKSTTPYDCSWETISISGGGGGGSSVLIAGDEGNGTGYWLSGDDRTKKYPVGDGSFDFTVPTSGAKCGTISEYSFALGKNITTDGPYQISVGEDIYSATRSVSVGEDINILGSCDLAVGTHLSAHASYEFILGENIYAGGDCSVVVGKNQTVLVSHSMSVGHDSYSNSSYEFLFGNGLSADGMHSFTVGSDSENTGQYGFSFGNGLSADGMHSFTVGSDSENTGQYGFSFGDGNTITGDHSHAEGRNNGIGGAYSFVHGQTNYATGDYSFVCGNESGSDGEFAFAHGSSTYAGGNFSRATGDSSYADAMYAIAHGYGTAATDEHAIALGYESSSSGPYSYSHGDGCTSSSYGSRATGEFCTASGPFAVAHGASNVASGSFANAFGNENVVPGAFSTAFGTNNNVSGNHSLVTGDLNVLSGHATNSYLNGYKNTANLKNSIATGSNNIYGSDGASESYCSSNILSCVDSTILQPSSSIVGGLGHALSGAIDRSIIGGLRHQSTPTDRIESSLIVGVYTKISGSINESLICGWGHTLSGAISKSIIGGQGHYSLQAFNSISDSLILGNYVEISESTYASLICGRNLKVKHAWSSSICGTDQYIYAADNMVVGGEYNSVNGSGGLVIGEYNAYAGWYSTLLGSHSYLYGKRSLSTGMWCGSRADMSVTMGNYCFAGIIGYALIWSFRSDSNTIDVTPTVNFRTNTSTWFKLGILTYYTRIDSHSGLTPALDQEIKYITVTSATYNILTNGWTLQYDGDNISPDNTGVGIYDMMPNSNTIGDGGTALMVGGDHSYSVGEESITYGRYLASHGRNSSIFGSHSTNNGDFSYVGGFKNYNDGVHSILHGYSLLNVSADLTESYGSVMFGAQSVASKTNTHSYGNFNNLHVNGSYALGSRLVTGDYITKSDFSVNDTDTNGVWKFTGDKTPLFTTGKCVVLFSTVGEPEIASGTQIAKLVITSVTFESNETTITYSTVNTTGFIPKAMILQIIPNSELYTSTTPHVVLGTYNKYNANNVLEVGAGTSVSRNNGLEVSSSGVVSVPMQNGNINQDYDVTTKKYVDTYTNRAGMCGVNSLTYTVTTEPVVTASVVVNGIDYSFSSASIPNWSSLTTGSYLVYVTNLGVLSVSPLKQLVMGVECPLLAINKYGSTEISTLRVHQHPTTPYDIQRMIFCDFKLRWAVGIDPSGIVYNSPNIGFTAGQLHYGGQLVPSDQIDGNSAIRVVYSYNGSDSNGEPLLQRVINGAENAYNGRCWLTGPNGRPIVSIFTNNVPVHTEIATEDFCFVHVFAGWAALVGSPTIVYATGQQKYTSPSVARNGLDNEVEHLKSNSIARFTKLMYSILISPSGNIQYVDTATNALWEDHR